MDMGISWRGQGFGGQGVFAQLEKCVRYVKACALPGSRSALLRTPVRRSERRGGWTGTVALPLVFRNQPRNHCTVTASVTVWETA